MHSAVIYQRCFGNERYRYNLKKNPCKMKEPKRFRFAFLDYPYTKFERELFIKLFGGELIDLDEEESSDNDCMMDGGSNKEKVCESTATITNIDTDNINTNTNTTD